MKKALLRFERFFLLERGLKIRLTILVYNYIISFGDRFRWHNCFPVLYDLYGELSEWFKVRLSKSRGG